MDNKYIDIFLLNKKLAKALSNYMEGVANDEELLLIEKWKNKSSDNLSTFNKIMAKDFLKQSYQSHKRIDSEEAYSIFNKRVHKNKNSKRYILFSLSAAVVILLIGFTMFFYSISKVIPEDIIEVAQGKVTFTLPTGEIFTLDNVVKQDTPKEINPETGRPFVEEVNTGTRSFIETNEYGEYNFTLSDGSTVFLNSSTQIAYKEAFDEDKREVYLSGEAYFKVSKDTRPFYVVTDHTRLRVYGTEFNINTLLNDKIQTVLVSGSVGIRGVNHTEEIMLEPNNLAEYTISNEEFTIQDVDPIEYIGWKDGLLVFQGQTLEHVMKKLVSWYNYKILFKDENLKEIKFSGYLRRYETIEGLLRAISQSTNVIIDTRDDVIIVEKK